MRVFTEGGDGGGFPNETADQEGFLGDDGKAVVDYCFIAGPR